MTAQQRFSLSGKFGPCEIPRSTWTCCSPLWAFLRQVEQMLPVIAAQSLPPLTFRTCARNQHQAWDGNAIIQLRQGGTVQLLPLFGASACDLWADMVSAHCSCVATVAHKKEVPTVRRRWVSLHVGFLRVGVQPERSCVSVPDSDVTHLLKWICVLDFLPAAYGQEVGTPWQGWSNKVWGQSRQFTDPPEVCCWTVEGSWSTWREPTWTRQEHANSPRTANLLAVRRIPTTLATLFSESLTSALILMS